MGYQYWPYDEVKISTDSKTNSVRISSPWLTVKRQVSPEFLNEIADVALRSHNGELSATDLPLLNSILSDLSQFPFAYILPTSKISSSHQYVDQLSKDWTPRELIEEIVSASSDVLLQEKSHDILAQFPMAEKGWLWGLEEAIQFASCESKVHPESLLTVARRFHNLDVTEKANQSDAWSKLQLLDAETLKKAAALVVRQNHFVTQMCTPSLSPAVNIAGGSADEVRKFIDAERGHDKILEKAIQDMGLVWSEVPVSANMRFLMATLKFAAENNFLAFTLLVDAFERNNYQETDPIAQLLIKAGHPKAAKYVNRHMEINDMGEHENMSLTFLKDMPLVSPEYAAAALKLCELASHCISTATDSVLELIEPNSRKTA